MATHQQTGKKGEDLAAEWLRQKGYQLIERNWRYSHYEIDIIASLGRTLHFIEVKTTRSDAFGWPEEAVTDAKMNSLMKAAEAYLDEHPEWILIQYDIVSVRLPFNSAPDIYLIEDVYL